MNHILRYLIPILFSAVAFVCGAETVDYTDTNADYQQQALPLSSEALDSSASDLEFYLPTQILGANAFRPQPTAKRTSSTQKNNYEFVKYGKVISIANRHFCQSKPLNALSSRIKPVHRLVCLGRLII